jgi:hypothetical protein
MESEERGRILAVDGTFLRNLDARGAVSGGQASAFSTRSSRALAMRHANATRMNTMKVSVAKNIHPCRNGEAAIATINGARI